MYILILCERILEHSLSCQQLLFVFLLCASQICEANHEIIWRILCTLQICHFAKAICIKLKSSLLNKKRIEFHPNIPGIIRKMCTGKNTCTKFFFTVCPWFFLCYSYTTFENFKALFLWYSSNFVVSCICLVYYLLYNLFLCTLSTSATGKYCIFRICTMLAQFRPGLR